MSERAVTKVLEVPGSYVLYERGGSYLLSVLCGTIAMYEVAIELNEEEREDYARRGPAAIAALAGQVAGTSQSYKRHVDFDAWSRRGLGAPPRKE